MLYIGLIIYCIYWSTSFSVAQLKWSVVELQDVSDKHNRPPARKDAVMEFMNKDDADYLILFGGRGKCTPSPCDDLWLFDMQLKKWTEVKVDSSRSRPTGRFSFEVGMWQDNFVIAAGELANDVVTSDIWMLSNVTNGAYWTRMDSDDDPKKPPGVYGTAGGIFPGDNLLYLGLGFSKSLRYSHVYLFDLEKRKWRLVAPDKNSYGFGHPHARCLQGGTMVSKESLILFGGCLSGGGTGGPCPSWDSWLLNTTNGEWLRLPDCASPRIYTSMARLPNTSYVVLYGGQETWIGQTFITKTSGADEISIFNSVDNTWKLVKSLGAKDDKYPTLRKGLSMATGRDGIYMFGGEDSEGNYDTKLWRLSGDREAVERSKITRSCGGPFNSFVNTIALHSIFMIIAWVVILQAGHFIARYFRHKDPWWFKMHRGLQVSGVVLCFAGFACAVASVRFGHFGFWHGGIGLVICLIAFQQPFNACCRPHKQPDLPKSRARFIWEIWHKNSGRLALLLAPINIALGFPLALAPVWSFIVYLVYLTFLVLLYVAMEIRRCTTAATTDSSSTGGAAIDMTTDINQQPSKNL